MSLIDLFTKTEQERRRKRRFKYNMTHLGVDISKRPYNPPSEKRPIIRSIEDLHPGHLYEVMHNPRTWSVFNFGIKNWTFLDPPVSEEKFYFVDILLANEWTSFYRSTKHELTIKHLGDLGVIPYKLGDDDTGTWHKHRYLASTGIFVDISNFKKLISTARRDLLAPDFKRLKRLKDLV
ncbi:MAG: hypothetical protein ACFFG0_48645 [Candidatus Thorarchaeota archaeon]